MCSPLFSLISALVQHLHQFFLNRSLAVDRFSGDMATTGMFTEKMKTLAMSPKKPAKPYQVPKQRKPKPPYIAQFRPFESPGLRRLFSMLKESMSASFLAYAVNSEEKSRQLLRESNTTDYKSFGEQKSNDAYKKKRNYV